MTARDAILSNDVGLKSQSPKPGVGHQRVNVFVGTCGTRKASNAKARLALPQRSGQWTGTSGCRESCFLFIASRGTWEQSSDGSSWETFWDVKASKVP